MDQRLEYSIACAEGDEVECEFCKQCILKDCTQACFVFDKNLDAVIEKCTKAERRHHLDKFLKMVNVLLNQGGGVIYIHTEQHLLAFWDELVDENLMDLVSDDTLFHDNFERQVIPDEKHVIFRVKPRDRLLSTKEFNSKVSLNKGLVDPTHSQMRRLMRADRERPEQDCVDSCYNGRRTTLEPTSLKQGHMVEFNESVDLQAKVVQENKLARTRGTGRPTKLVNYWCAGEGQGLRLPQYIAAFAKQTKGGSFFLGLREKKVERGTRWIPLPNTEGLAALFETDKKFWKDDKNDNILHLTADEHVPKLELRTGEFICEGVHLTANDKDVIKRQLKEFFLQNLLWLSITGKDARRINPPDDIVDVIFHPVSTDAETMNSNNGHDPNVARGGRTSHRNGQEASQLYVVEAKVKYFHGVCFQTKDGPEAYTFENPAAPYRARYVEMTDWANHQRCNSLLAIHFL